jgi:hypothetical protein
MKRSRRFLLWVLGLEESEAVNPLLFFGTPLFWFFFLVTGAISFCLLHPSGHFRSGDIADASAFAGFIVVSVGVAVYRLKTHERLGPALCTFALAQLTLLLLMAVLYFRATHADPNAFNDPINHPLSKIDAIYFAVVTFATIGYGDIAPTSQTMRLLVTVNIIVNFVMVAAILTLLIALVASRYLAITMKSSTGAPRQHDQ